MWGPIIGALCLGWSMVGQVWEVEGILLILMRLPQIWLDRDKNRKGKDNQGVIRENERDECFRDDNKICIKT